MTAERVARVEPVVRVLGGVDHVLVAIDGLVVAAGQPRVLATHVVRRVGQFSIAELFGDRCSLTDASGRIDDVDDAVLR